MKLAILGNSHTAALMHALRAEPSLATGIDLTFFASIGRTMGDFAVQADRLVPQTAELRDSISNTAGGATYFEPKAFDMLAFVGLGFNMPLMDKRLSVAVQDAVIRNCVVGSIAWQVIGLVRTIADLPILVGHTPLRAGEVTNQHSDMLSNATPYEAQLKLAQTYWLTQNAQVLPQPDITRYCDILTRRSFSRGSRGLRGAGLEHDNADRSHMNAEYGAIYLRHMFAALRAM